MISVILATKNGEKYIDRAIKSVLAQSERNFELIIVSDGSTDSTVHRVKEWVATDSKIKLIELAENIGPGRARDRGIREATGEYIATIDDDDYWISKDKLALQEHFLQQNSEYVLVGVAKTHIVDEQENLIKYYFQPVLDTDIRKKMLIKNCFISSSVMFKKDAYIQAGGYKNMYLSEDYDLWLRLGTLGKMVNLGDIDIAYTWRENSASKKRILELYRNNISLARTYKKNYRFYYIGVIKSYLQIALFHLKNLT